MLVTTSFIEPGDIENRDAGVGILFLAVLYADIITSGLGDRHIYFRYNTTSGDIVDNTTEQLDLKHGYSR